MPERMGVVNGESIRFTAWYDEEVGPGVNAEQARFRFQTAIRSDNHQHVRPAHESPNPRISWPISSLGLRDWMKSSRSGGLLIADTKRFFWILYPQFDKMTGDRRCR